MALRMTLMAVLTAKKLYSTRKWANCRKRSSRSRSKSLSTTWYIRVKPSHGTICTFLMDLLKLCGRYKRTWWIIERKTLKKPKDNNKLKLKIRRRKSNSAIFKKDRVLSKLAARSWPSKPLTCTSLTSRRSSHSRCARRSRCTRGTSTPIPAIIWRNCNQRTRTR